MTPSAPRSITIISWSLTAVLLLVAAVCLAFLMPQADEIIRSAYDGQSFGFVNRYVAIHRSLDPEGRTLAYFVANGKPILLRLTVIFTALSMMLLFSRRRLADVLTRFLFAPEPPELLALFRIAVGSALLIWLLISPVRPFADLPGELAAPPPGWSWIRPILPPGPVLLIILQIMLGASAIMMTVGYRTRQAAWTAAIMSIVVMGIPQFYGKIDHYHHLAWFTMILAASPSGDAWSFDALRRRGSKVTVTPERSVRYGFPLRCVMLLIGFMYFFPGLWKVIIGGTAWVDSTLRYQMYAKWMAVDWIPAVRPDTIPHLLTIIGIIVVLFELAYIFVMFSEKWRPWLAFGGIIFHISVFLLMHINFLLLALCYVVFLRSSLLERRGGIRPAPSGPDVPQQTEHHYVSGPPRLTGYVGGALILLTIGAGLTLTDSWPVAVYPTFAGVPQPRIFVMTLELDGAREIRPLEYGEFRKKYGPSRAEGLVHQVIWEPDPRRAGKKAMALLGVLAGTIPEIGAASNVNVFKDLLEVDPSRWKEPPVRREPVATIGKNGNQKDGK